MMQFMQAASNTTPEFTTSASCRVPTLFLSTAFAASLLVAAVAPTAHAQERNEDSQPRAFTLSGDYRGTHDPSIIKQGNTYYVFATGTAFAPPPAPPAVSGDKVGTGAGSAPEATPAYQPRALGQLPVRCSTDLQVWKRCGQVLDAIPDWIKQRSPTTKELWAPDISFFDGTYHLYYAYSAFGVNTSGIALATNKTLDAGSPDYKWQDQGLVLESTEKDDFNAIDPNLFIDEQGQTWLAFGSFWSGIKLRRIDRKTGKQSSSDTTIYSLASRRRPDNPPPAKPGLPPDWEAIEAPFLIHHGRYYYLFVSWDLCCRGTNSTYRGMVGRSTSVTGPYVDKVGVPMTQGGGSPVLAPTSKWVGPGGQSLLKAGDGYIIVFHAYDAKTGRPALHVSTVGWKDNWPLASLEGDAK